MQYQYSMSMCLVSLISNLVYMCYNANHILHVHLSLPHSPYILGPFVITRTYNARIHSTRNPDAIHYV